MPKNSQTNSTQKKQKTTISPRNEIIHWVENFVEVPHPVFADMPPCPYARQARLKGRVDFVELNDNQSDDAVWELIEKFDVQKKDVLVIIASANRWTANETKKLGRQLNDKYKHNDLVVLEDHPDIEEKVKDLTLNNGKYTLLLIQSRTKLKNFEDKLRQTDYYKNWSKNLLESVTGDWRHPLKNRS